MGSHNSVRYPTTGKPTANKKATYAKAALKYPAAVMQSFGLKYHRSWAPYPAFHYSHMSPTKLADRPEKQEGLQALRGLPSSATACQASLAFEPAGCHFSQGRKEVGEGNGV
jgi:hypothetical protein